MPIESRVREAAAALERLGVRRVARVLFTETALGGFSGELSGLTAVPFRRIPHFREPAAGGWPGAVLAGSLNGVATAVVEGRVHLHEGFLPGEAALPVRVFAALGARRVVLLAAGRRLGEGVGREAFLLVADRLDLTLVPALKGVRDVAGRASFDPPPLPGWASPSAAAAAAASGVSLATGVAALVHGPLWPSPAEAGLLRRFGAEAVAMALSPELATAAALGLEAAALLRIGETWGAADVAFCTALLASC